MIDIPKDHRKTFWYYKPTIDFPPEAVKNIDNYQNVEFLNIYASDVKEQKYWIEKLPSLSEVKILWVGSNVNQKMFDTICHMTNLIGLCIGRTTVKTIDLLGNLKDLKYLRLCGITKVENIDVLSTMDKLQVLNIENVKKISDFSVLKKMKNLEELAIDGSMWTTQMIDSFEFISNLINLKHLSIVNTRSKVKDFTPLLNLKQLETFNSSYFYPQEEFEKLRALPYLKYSNVSYVLEPEDYLEQLRRNLLKTED